MTNRLKQVQIWLDPDQHQVLTEIAQHTEDSLSELLRRIIQDWLTCPGYFSHPSPFLQRKTP